MQILEQIIPYQLLYPITDKYVKEEMVFFDIETTGFSAEMSYVYLIGCAYYRDHSYHLIQWFLDDIEQERELISCFFEFIKAFSLLIHYNGTGFDLPYLTQKVSAYQLPYSFQHIDSFDIYKQIIPYKKSLPLANLKLRTLELFFQIKRLDPYSGGDLIELFTKYLAFHTLEQKNVTTSKLETKKQSGLPLLGPGHAKDFLDAILLHNQEDISSLFTVSAILAFVDLFQGKGRVTSAEFKDFVLLVELDLPNQLPQPIRHTQELLCQSSTFELIVEANQKTAILKIPVVVGELKFFFPNYKDYYYLPLEDTAVHKSVGEYVDKNFRQNAKANNCYTKKNSTFLPQKGIYKTPAFRFDSKDKITWFEPDDQFLTDLSQLTQYVQSLLI